MPGMRACWLTPILHCNKTHPSKGCAKSGVVFVEGVTVRMLFATAALLVGLGSARVFADELTEGVFEAPLKIQELSMICESARLTDMERRECRAMFKTATSDDKMLVAYKVFDERINGPSD